MGRVQRAYHLYPGSIRAAAAGKSWDCWRRAAAPPDRNAVMKAQGRRKEDQPMGSRDMVAPEAIELSHEEITRYSRHLIMPEVGIQGQRKLKAGSVLLIGA